MGPTPEAQVGQHTDPPQGFGVDYAMCGLLARDNWIRRRCVRLVTHRYFARSVAAAIVANSVILGLSDYSVVVSGLNPASFGKKVVGGQLVDAYSLQNWIVQMTDMPLTLFFTWECVVKIIAMGFKGKGSYSSNPWNVLAFLVLVPSLVASLPLMPNIRLIRAIRVLRPLRGLFVFPGTKRLVEALVKTLPALRRLVTLQIFVFVTFGILGIQLFGGTMNHRCRVTQVPIKLPLDNASEVIWPVPDDYIQQARANLQTFQCTDAPLLDYEGGTYAYTKESSPWSAARDCFWPVDENDELLCAVPGQPGNHECSDGMTCGSDYDAFGNPRFIHQRAMSQALYLPSLNWGLTTFDNIGRVFFTIFQCIMKGGWTATMYMVTDSSQPTVGAIFFALLILGSFFLMNWTLAAISENLNLGQTSEEAVAERSTEGRKATLESDDVETQDRKACLKAAVSHKLFARYIALVTLANIMVLALDRYPMPMAADGGLEFVNFVLWSVFLVEMTLKLIAFGPREYTRDKFHRLDAFIVATGMLELIASPPSFMGNPTTKGGVSVLRTFRGVRVFKLVRDWKSVRTLLEKSGRKLVSVTHLGVLLFLVIYTFALVGAQLFGNTMRFDNEGYPMSFTLEGLPHGTVPRNNFHTLPWAMLTVFQIIIGKNWSRIMYDGILGNGMIASIYFISLVILGYFLLMNIFLALLVGDNDGHQNIEKDGGTAQKKNGMGTGAKVAPLESERTLITRHPDEIDFKTTQSRVNLLCRETSAQTSSLPTVAMDSGSQSLTKAQQGSTDVKTPGRSLFLFAQESTIRRVACYLSGHQWISLATLALIFVSCIVEAVDNPLADPTSDFATFLKVLDQLLTAVFVIEMKIKIVAMGLILHKGAYLRDPWNTIDGIIVFSALLTLLAESAGQYQSARLLRGISLFRPLRLIGRRPSLKVVLSAMFADVSKAGTALVVCVMFFVSFGIVAVNYLKETFNSCRGDVLNTLSDAQLEFLVAPTTWAASSDLQRSLFSGTPCETVFADSTGSVVTSEFVCKCWGADWGPVVPQNFDNIGAAMLTMFEMLMGEGWADVMMVAIDSTGIAMQPVRDNNMFWALFFVMFLVVSSFMGVSLIVSAIFDNFHQTENALGGDFMLTPGRIQWTRAHQVTAWLGPVRVLENPRQVWRRRIISVITAKRFERFIGACITVNTIIMATQSFGESTLQSSMNNMMNGAFAAIFTMEAIVKLVAFGVEYFKDKWNQFDFFVVLGTLASFAAEVLAGASSRTLVMLVRAFRVTRTIRLIKFSKGIRSILLTLYFALPGLGQVTSVLFLVVFIYTAMGVHIFAKVALSGSIDSHANFQDFGKAFLFMLRAATGEGWSSCMHDLASITPGCVVDPPYDDAMCGFSNFDGCIPLNGCGSPVAYLFFCSFSLVVTYIMVKLTIAVFLRGFSHSYEDERNVLDVLTEFQSSWAKMDPKATGFIKVEKMLLLVNLLKPPLGSFSPPMTSFLLYMRQLELPLYDAEYVYFHDVLLAMTSVMAKPNACTPPCMTVNYEPQNPGVPCTKRRTVFFAHQFFAARCIHRQVTRWQRIKRQLEREHLDEYKNEMKKPRGRPRKQSDARVLPLDSTV